MRGWSFGGIRLWRTRLGWWWQRLRKRRKRYWWWSVIRGRARRRGGIGRSLGIGGWMRLGRCWRGGATAKRIVRTEKIEGRLHRVHRGKNTEATEKKEKPRTQVKNRTWGTRRKRGRNGSMVPRFLEGA